MTKFAGIDFVSATPTMTHEVEVGEVVVGDQKIFIERIRHNSYKDKGEFFPARVFSRDSREITLWSFKQENFSNGIGRLVSCNGEPVIALIRRDKIEKIIPIFDLPKLQSIKIGERVETIGGRGPQEMFDLKVMTARALGLGIVSSEEEKLILRLTRQAEELERAAKEAAKAERLRMILVRPEISGYSEDGKCCHGIPVTEEEWPSLPNSSSVILVKSYNDETGEMGELVEAFFVKKTKGGRPEKHLPKAVTARKPQAQTLASQYIPEAKGNFYAFVGGKVQKVTIFTRDDVDLLRGRGLNSGTLVATELKDEQGRYVVEKLVGNGIQTVGPVVSL